MEVVKYWTNGSSVIIKGGSAKKRLENWAIHFKNLLGKSAKIPKTVLFPNVPVSDTLPMRRPILPYQIFEKVEIYPLRLGGENDLCGTSSQNPFIYQRFGSI